VNLNKESKDNQWLGVTVKSQGIGGKVVVSEDHILCECINTGSRPCLVFENKNVGLLLTP